MADREQRPVKAENVRGNSYVRAQLIASRIERLLRQNFTTGKRRAYDKAQVH